jgi:hypothetical protein
MLNIHLTVPIFSAVKSSYLLSIVPCIAVVILRGFRILASACRPPARTCLYAGLALWAIVAYLGYFSLAPLRIV